MLRAASLAHHRQASPECFDLAALSESGAKVYPAAADGYYVMLRPLAPGRHVLNFGGMLPGDLSQAVTYELTVE